MFVNKHISRAHISKSRRYFTANSSTYYFHMKTKILADFQICISVPLSCNNSVFNNINYLQTDGTAQGPHMSCSYADIAMAYHDRKALSYFLSSTTWKRFRDDTFVAWEHGIDTYIYIYIYIYKN